MKTPALTGREWLTFRGRRILWDCFIDIFDDWRSDRRLDACSSEVYENALRMGYGVQVLTDCWAHGMDSVYAYTDGLEEFHLKQPQEQQLPEALYELVEQIEKYVRFNIDHQLDRAAQRSVKIFERREEERLKEQVRHEQVQKIADTIHTDRSTLLGKITWLLTLQERKMQGGYEVDESQRFKEILAAELWCSLLMHSINSEYITHGQMKMLVEDEIVDEFTMSSLLQDKYHDHRDYEWYSEDYLGCDLNAETILRVEDILEEAEPVLRKILGIGQDIEL